MTILFGVDTVSSSNGFQICIWFQKIYYASLGLGKRTQWQVTIHDGVPSIADPWFQYLDKKKLMAGDEVVFYFQFYDHAWELLIRKEIEWEEEDIHLED